MKFIKLSVLSLCIALSVFSCKKDDDVTDTVVIEVRDRDEVQEEDIVEIEAYLKSHYYNSAAYDAITDPSSADLEIVMLEDTETTAPVGHTILWDILGTSVSDAPVLFKETRTFANTSYDFYVLKLNKGGGEAPNFSDEVRVNYEGFLLDEEHTVFDSAVNPVLFDLTTLIPGWRKVMPLFNTAELVDDTAGDGVVNFVNHGVGAMFLPSGLAYFSSGTTGISTYTPIAFKFDLVKKFEADHDADGIPSYMEDLNNDGEFNIADPDDDTVTHDDTDGDGIPNYFDPDDDGDGVPTINEDIDGDGDPTNDIGENGIAKYLDPEETESN